MRISSLAVDLLLIFIYLFTDVNPLPIIVVSFLLHGVKNIMMYYYVLKGNSYFNFTEVLAFVAFVLTVFINVSLKLYALAIIDTFILVFTLLIIEQKEVK